MIRYKLDGYIIDIYKLSKITSKGKNIFHIYLQYNNLKAQTDFLVDIDNASNIDRLFTERQKKLFLKKLKTLV